MKFREFIQTNARFKPRLKVLRLGNSKRLVLWLYPATVVAKWLDVRPTTLRRWSIEGKGPARIWDACAPGYHLDDMELWEREVWSKKPPSPRPPESRFPFGCDVEVVEV